MPAASEGTHQGQIGPNSPSFKRPEFAAIRRASEVAQPLRLPPKAEPKTHLENLAILANGEGPLALAKPAANFAKRPADPKRPKKADGISKEKKPRKTTVAKKSHKYVPNICSLVASI